MRASHARLNCRGRGFSGKEGKSVSAPKEVVSVFEGERGSRGSTEVEEIRMGSLVSRLERSRDPGNHREGMEASSDLEPNKISQEDLVPLKGLKGVSEF